MINQGDQNEKIIKMKLQTAKILWKDGRKDATFLLLESINDPRGDDLRERMGFADDYEVGLSKTPQRFSQIQVAGVVLCSALLFFILGFLVSPDSDATPLIEATLDNNVVETISTSTSVPDNSLSQQLIELTATSDSEMSTVSAFRTQQVTMEAIVNSSATARYEEATATSVARTQATGN
ncbi:MAG: hypothetical protein WBC91_02365 [Phototrophicaceae bacterium]